MLTQIKKFGNRVCHGAAWKACKISLLFFDIEAIIKMKQLHGESTTMFPFLLLVLFFVRASCLYVDITSIDFVAKRDMFNNIMYSTMRLQMFNTTHATCTGTGFFYQHQNSYFLVTNKHVLTCAEKKPVEQQTRQDLQVSFSGIIHANKDNQPRQNPFIKVTGTLNDQSVLWHSDSSVDLAALRLTEVQTFTVQRACSIRTNGLFACDFQKTQSQKTPDPFISYFSKNVIHEKLRALEEVIMIGYPMGLWDAFNALPITRQGITASVPNMKYQRKSVGLVDIFSIGGSSGSPIVIMSSTRQGFDSLGNYVQIATGPFLSLLGVLSEAHIYQNQIHNRSSDDTIPLFTEDLLNLGIYVQASEIERLFDDDMEMEMEVSE